MQRPGTEAIRTQIQPSKPKGEMTVIKYSQNTNRKYRDRQLREQLFPKRWPLSNPNLAKHNRNTRKVNSHRISDTKNMQKRTTPELPPWNGH